MVNRINIREALESDRSFINSLSPTLAQVANLAWHSNETVEKMQDDYIDETLAPTSKLNITFIAEEDSKPLGFIHVRERTDDISQEKCGTIPLIAVAPNTQGKGVGKILMEKAQHWSKEQGYRLLHLEVFANNNKAQNFYKHLGFQSEMLHMIKEI